MRCLDTCAPQAKSRRVTTIICFTIFIGKGIVTATVSLPQRDGNWFPRKIAAYTFTTNQWISRPKKPMTAKDATGFYAFLSQGNRAISPFSWGEFPANLQRKPGEEGKKSFAENSKIQWRQRHEMKISVPCRGRTRPWELQQIMARRWCSSQVYRPFWARFCFATQVFVRNFPVTPTPSTFSKSTAVQMGGVLPYGRRTAIQMGGVLLGFLFLPGLEARNVQRYKWEVYCRTFFETSRGWGFRNSSVFGGCCPISRCSRNRQESGRPSWKSAEIIFKWALLNFCLFRPFPDSAKSTWEPQKTEEKAFFLRYPQILL